jgi:hypothetical protein
MQRGTVAMLDLLGYKGLYRSASAPAVLKALSTVEAATHDCLACLRDARDPPAVTADLPNVKVAFFSDTLVITSAESEQLAATNPSLALALSLHWAVALAKYAMMCAALITPSMAYRGCISVGEFLTSDSGRFYLGPAVDDAASHMNVAQGAFVWCTPSSVETVWRCHATELGFVEQLQEYAIPLKRGDRISSFAITPTTRVAVPVYRQPTQWRWRQVSVLITDPNQPDGLHRFGPSDLRNRLLSAFSRASTTPVPPDVIDKLAQTQAHFDAIEMWLKMSEDFWRDREIQTW